MLRAIINFLTGLLVRGIIFIVIYYSFQYLYHDTHYTEDIGKIELKSYNYSEYASNVIPDFNTSPKYITFPYVLRGHNGTIEMVVYGGLKDYLSKLPRSITYNIGESPPTSRDFAHKFIDEPYEQIYLDQLVNLIKSETTNYDDRARIAISLVQHIPYDYDSYYNNGEARFPYEVLYDNKGVCQDKSYLLAALLKKLGYGVVLFEFERENHMAVGIKCPMQYSYRNTGYCFVETTSPTIITYANGDYIGVGKLKSMPEIIPISNGRSFDASEEYNDAQTYDYLMKQGEVLPEDLYNQWLELTRKYHLDYN